MYTSSTPPLPHDLLGLAAVLLGVFFVVQVVEQAGGPPHFRVLAGQAGKVLHSGRHLQGVPLQGGCLGVRGQQVPGLLFGQFVHGGFLLCQRKRFWTRII